ncbi:MAG: asparagine synthase-related protein [Porticoccaceae bacterium]
MSAIAGILYFNGAPAKPGMVEILTDAMKTRGPDEQTHWIEGSVTLGHCMLRTTPESLAEHQPLLSQDGNLVLVWDGRLDNRQPLIANLRLAGVTPRSNTDAELVLQSYAIWGEQCPTYLLGDFAFAIWDKRQQRLFCARDHWGARPFCYTFNNEFFAFASDEEAFLQLPSLSIQPNEERIAYSLCPSFLSFDHSQSWLKDIWYLSAGTSKVVYPNSTTRNEAYWQLTSRGATHYSSYAECQEDFLALFTEAVRCRMRSSGTVTAMMSGGLDSANIAVIVKQLAPEEIPAGNFHTYSVTSDNPENCIESQSILTLAQHIGKNCHFVSVPSCNGILQVNDLSKAAWSSPHPVINSILLPAMMFMAANRDGHRIMLHGMGGDLAMHAPILYMSMYLNSGEWSKAWQACRDASKHNTYLQGNSPLTLLLRSLASTYIPDNIKPHLKNIKSIIFQKAIRESLINRDFEKKLQLREKAKQRIAKMGTFKPDIQNLHMQALSPPHGITSGLSGYTMAGSRYGMELRDPWSDKRVIEFFFNLPLEFKVRDGWTKHLARMALPSTLGSKVIWRTDKSHVGWKLIDRLMRDSRDYVISTINENPHILAEYIDEKRVRKITATYRSKNTMSFEDQVILYGLMSLIIWIKRTNSTKML